jgi:hypothetical protein
VTRRDAPQDYSLRSLQSLLGVSRSVLTGLIDAGFVQPARGRRNELRFTFQDVVVLRTAFQLQSAKIASRKILRALAKLKSELPDELPLSGIRITAVGDSVGANGMPLPASICSISKSRRSRVMSRSSMPPRAM